MSVIYLLPAKSFQHLSSEFFLSGHEFSPFDEIIAVCKKKLVDSKKKKKKDLIYIYIFIILLSKSEAILVIKLM